MARARAAANSPASREADVDAAGPRPGGRPRDAALDEAIILATRDRLIRDGYSRMTIGDIATDAKVSRPTLYRRWSTKFSYFAAFYRDESKAEIPEAVVAVLWPALAK